MIWLFTNFVARASNKLDERKEQRREKPLFLTDWLLKDAPSNTSFSLFINGGEKWAFEERIRSVSRRKERPRKAGKKQSEMETRA